MFSRTTRDRCSHCTSARIFLGVCASKEASGTTPQKDSRPMAHYDPLAPLPLVRTHAGLLANPFVAVHKTKRQHARLLAVAFEASHDERDLYAALRGLTRAYDLEWGTLAGYLAGCYFTRPGGIAPLPFELLRAFAVLYLGVRDRDERGHACGLDLGTREVVLREHARCLVVGAV